MIMFDPTRGWSYSFQDKGRKDYYEHAVQCFGFLLNTPERRRLTFSWSDFAAMMRGYSSHPKTALLASIIEKD